MWVDRWVDGRSTALFIDRRLNVMPHLIVESVILGRSPGTPSELLVHVAELRMDCCAQSTSNKDPRVSI